MGLFLTSLISSFLFSNFWDLNLFSVLFPFILLNITVGFITPNITSSNLKIFPKTAGTAMAVQAGGISTMTAIGIFIISQLPFQSLFDITSLIGILVGLQMFLFFIMSQLEKKKELPIEA
jgi:MFS family permease